MKRIRPAPRSPGPRAGREWGLGAQARRPRPHPDRGPRGPQRPGAAGSLGRTGGPSLGPALDGAPRPSPDGLPRHLRDKVSSTSSSSGPARGAPSLPRLPLFFKIIAPKSPPGGARRRPRPAAPRRSRLLPPRGACPGSRRPRSGPPKGLGARVEVGASRARGSLPGPAVPAANRACRTDARAEVRTLGRSARTPCAPPPAPRRATWGPGRRAVSCQRREAGQPRRASGGRAAAPGLGRGAPGPRAPRAGLPRGRPAPPALVGEPLGPHCYVASSGSNSSPFKVWLEGPPGPE